jgi:hypothetical protein
MHKVTFFPLGNADCCRIDLECGKKILFDYADTRDRNDPEDLRWDLPKALRDDLEEADRDYYEVVAFSHLDKDHIKGAPDFFFLEHAKKYQSADRIKMRTMWVPAAMITEDGPDDEEARTLQSEARYRFKAGKGIRVFSRPERLRKWCEKNGIRLEDRLEIITDAGQLAPEFTKVRDGAEFFVHSPFAKRLNATTVEERNEDAILLHVTFVVENVETRFLLTSDATHEVLADIVTITRARKRSERLKWDIAKIPHHCSYLSLGPDKGEDETTPVKDVAWLYEDEREKNGIIVSSSRPMPKKGTEEDEDQNPPHRQAGNYYKGVLDDPDDQFRVTMEHPRVSKPEPLVIIIDASKATVEKQSARASITIISNPAPRAG